MKTKIIVAEQWPGAETYYYWGEGQMEHSIEHPFNPQGNPSTTRIDWVWCKRTVEYPQPEDFDRKEIEFGQRAIPTSSDNNSLPGRVRE